MSAERGGVLLRCDADAVMGSGHFFRCLALAEGVKEQGERATLAMRAPGAALKAHAAALGVEVLALEVASGGGLRELGAGYDAVVIDGYHFDEAYYVEASGGAPVYALDDMADRALAVDGVINVGPHAEGLVYRGLRPGARRLMGVRYTLLRGQFRRERARIEREGMRVRERVERVLVTMGGADASDETSKALRALEGAGFAGEVTVVLGPNAAHREQVGRELARSGRGGWRLAEDVREMAALMAAHDVAISAGGGTSWEMACVGLPALQITVADNQRAQQVMLAERGVTRALGWREAVDEATIEAALRGVSSAQAREGLARAGMALIDGQGAVRVARALLGVEEA